MKRTTKLALAGTLAVAGAYLHYEGKPGMRPRIGPAALAGRWGNNIAYGVESDADYVFAGIARPPADRVSVTQADALHFAILDTDQEKKAYLAADVNDWVRESAKLFPSGESANVIAKQIKQVRTDSLDYLDYVRRHDVELASHFPRQETVDDAFTKENKVYYDIQNAKDHGHPILRVPVAIGQAVENGPLGRLLNELHLPEDKRSRELVRQAKVRHDLREAHMPAQDALDHTVKQDMRSVYNAFGDDGKLAEVNAIKSRLDARGGRFVAEYAHTDPKAAKDKGAEIAELDSRYAMTIANRASSGLTNGPASDAWKQARNLLVQIRREEAPPAAAVGQRPGSGSLSGPLSGPSF